jgi:hypothetical protein
MRWQNVMTFAVGIAAFIGGLGLGLYVGGSRMDAFAIHGASAQAHLSSDATLPDGEDEDSHLRKRVADVERQLVDLKEQEDRAILADHLAFHKKYHLTPGTLNDDLTITPAMIDYLQVTAPEKKELEGHLRDIAAQIRKLEQQHLKLVKQGDDSVTYEITPYTEGKALEDNLKSDIDADLGAERGAVFTDCAKWQYDELFSGFGNGQTEIQITRTDQSGPGSYRLNETFGDGSGEERPIGTTLPSRYAGLIQLDPSP